MATIKQIAENIGVNVATVSRILNGKTDRYSAQTIDRVRAESVRLNYVVDDVARSIRTGKSNVIGLIMPGAPRELLAGIESVADESGFLIKTFPAQFSEHIGPKGYFDRIRTIICMQRVAGIIMHHFENHDFIDFLQKEKIPGVITSVGGATGKYLARLHPDNERGGVLMAEHLVHLGHRDFICVGRSKRNLSANVRLRGFLDTLAEHGISVDNDYIIFADSDTERLQLFAGKLQNVEKRPTAAFFTSDTNAIAGLTFCQNMGLKVPEDISIAGYGNHGIGEITKPALTTIEENHFELGRLAFKKLMSIIAGDLNPDDGALDVNLVLRESTMVYERGK